MAGQINDCEHVTLTRPRKTATRLATNENIKKYLKEPVSTQVKRGDVCGGRGNSCDVVLIGSSFASDWMKGWLSPVGQLKKEIKPI